MRLIAHDPYADPSLAAELGVTLTDLDTVFREADFVCVNCPLSNETHHLVNRDRLALMKPTAFLVNTARGPIVDQAALTEVLQAGGIAGAGLDVLEQEPPDADDPLLDLDNVILAPHALCWTSQLFSGSGAADVRAVLAVMAGQAPHGIVNRDVIERPGWQARLSDYAQRFGEG
jgi:D-3-phosphoglycerate dehydrogenase